MEARSDARDFLYCAAVFVPLKEIRRITRDSSSDIILCVVVPRFFNAFRVIDTACLKSSWPCMHVRMSDECRRSLLRKIRGVNRGGRKGVNLACILGRAVSVTAADADAMHKRHDL